MSWSSGAITCVFCLPASIMSSTPCAHHHNHDTVLNISHKQAGHGPLPTGHSPPDRAWPTAHWPCRASSAVLSCRSSDCRGCSRWGGHSPAPEGLPCLRIPGHHVYCLSHQRLARYCCTACTAWCQVSMLHHQREGGRQGPQRQSLGQLLLCQLSLAPRQLSGAQQQPQQGLLGGVNPVCSPDPWCCPTGLAVNPVGGPAGLEGFEC
mmetsp:Transcript_22054/g.48158  ORF Transcript_22054/g.48158 Transcript_22054/m.48158 type:complete len:207 (-) Transcript_22054:147-767(-)